MTEQNELTEQTTDEQNLDEKELTEEELQAQQEQLEATLAVLELLGSPKNRAKIKALNVVNQRARNFLQLLFKYDTNHSNLTEQLEPIADRLQDVIIEADEPFAAINKPYMRRKVLHSMKKAKRDFYRVNTKYTKTEVMSTS